MTCAKKAISGFVAFLLILSLAFIIPAPEASASALAVWDGSVAKEYAGGDGTEEKPYLISNGSELALLMQQINSTVKESEQTTDGKYYKLTADIILNDISDFENWDTAAPANTWTPGGAVVNHSIKGFSGHLDGNNYDVIGIYINSNKQYNGLFGYIYNGQVENLGISHSYISGTQFSAALSGHIRAAAETVSISGCTITDTVVNGSSTVGGIGGYVEAFRQKVVIERCSNGADISAKYNYAGGIGGNIVAHDIPYDQTNEYAVTVKECANTGKISGGKGVGGIIGTSKDFISAMSGTGSIALLIQNCVNTGRIVSSDTHKGAIAGTVGPDGRVDKSVIVDIIDCYSAQEIGADEIYGYTEAATTVTDSKFLEPDGLASKDSFKNFDFNKTWDIIENGSAPSLRKLGDTFGKGRLTALEFFAALDLAIGKISSEDVEINNIDFDNDDDHDIADINAFINYIRGKGAANR